MLSSCGGELSSLGCDVSEQLELIAAPLRLSKHNVRNWPVASATYRAGSGAFKTYCTQLCRSGVLAHVVAGKYADHLPLYRQSKYIVAREWS